MSIGPEDRRIGRIPVRNLWLLMLYASDLTRFGGALNALTDPEINDIPDLVGRLLADCVERRLRRNLTRGYRHREAALTRVRGCIDLLTTESRQLLTRGEVFCRFEQLTIDTARNRLVCAALDLMPRLVSSNQLAHRCRSLASTLARAGVCRLRPSPAELTRDQIGRNDAADHLLVALAKLAFHLALPTEDAGTTALVSSEREEIWVRRVFEKAVLGFARAELEPIGWLVRGGVPLQWQKSPVSSSIASLLPRMLTDVILDAPGDSQRLVIDTKFTSILRAGRFGDNRFKSAYLYQMYAYVRSQEGIDAKWDCAAGLLLHPSVGETIYETVAIQNHTVTFATLDLSCPATAIRAELRNILRGSVRSA